MDSTPEPILGVLARGGSFAAAWEQIGVDARATLRVGASLAELAPVGDLCGLLVSLVGEESEAAEILQECRAAGAEEIAAVAADEDHRLAVAVMQAGASEYFALPPDLERLRGWARERSERVRVAERVAARVAHDRSRYDFSRIVGSSPRLLEQLDRASRVIPRDAVTVLITGETGTGKELLAQAIHYNGPRARQPFLEVNCAALPENLLEAELFGYERGAFTDAKAAKPGLFEAAHGGTLFLDEIGEISASLQGKLLKVLEDKRVRRLGSVRTTQVDVRIVAATHQDLPARVRTGLFRRDLFYRLNVLTTDLPPLRERGSDVLVLAEYFLDHFAGAYDLPRPALSPEIRQALLSYSWPGNVRELRNGIERAILMSDGGLRVDDLIVPDLETAAPVEARLPFPATMTEIEESAAAAMVERFAGNKTAAAEALAISRTRLYRLLGDTGEP